MIASNSSDLAKPSFLVDHAVKTINFYIPQCLDDNNGGFYQGYLDEGQVYDSETKDLIGTARFIVDFSLLNLLTNSNKYNSFINHGLDFLINVHKDEENGGYHQIVKRDQPQLKENKRTYSHAFVMLALALAMKSGIKGLRKHLTQVFNTLEDNFWEETHNLYATEASFDFSNILSYRGQNCNMHITEGLIATYEATGEEKYISRAFNVARRVTQDLAGQTNGLIWEHYTEDWNVDKEYNKDDPENLYRPFGFLTGHLLEWSKLLLILERYRKADWQRKTALRLFDKATEIGWDYKNLGLTYTFDFNKKILVEDRYYWVQAEGIAASYLLWKLTGEDDYLNWYNDIWNYSLDNLVDAKHGGWFRIVDKEGQKRDNRKSIPGKTDYHTINACYDVYRAAETD